MAASLADNIQLVATDLDGTLLLNFTKRVREEAYPIIERVCDRVPFFAASGRQHASLRLLFAPVADRIGYVCENGAVAVWQDEMVVKHLMPREIAMEASHLAMETPDCKYFISGVSTSYAPADDPAYIEHLRRNVGNSVVAVERPEDVPEDITKVAFMVAKERNDEINQEFTEHFGSVCNIVTSGTQWIDLLMPGVNKGVAFTELANVLGISLADMAAFGDAENDREMLEAVGHPYLMDPCAQTMLDLAPRCKRCKMVEDTLLELLGE
jgi:Cof subfamily protein (haloacid dehalogenase superfamily)